MLNVFNVKTKFQIQYCHNEKLYDFTILNSSNNEILFNSQYSNIIEINKIIQLHKQTINVMPLTNYYTTLTCTNKTQ